MILTVMNSIYAIAYIEAWNQDFNGVWTRDLEIPVRCSNQLSYEGTDVGSWLFVGSNRENNLSRRLIIIMSKIL